METQRVFLKGKFEKHIMCFFHVSHRYIFCFSQDLSIGNMLSLFQTKKETLIMFQKDKFGEKQKIYLWET